MSSWSGRELCEDGACVGVIGTDGLCGVCGKAGVMPTTEPDAESDAESESESESESDTESETESESATDADADEWTKRRLCADDACIGVLGDDGRCGTCGKRG